MGTGSRDLPGETRLDDALLRVSPFGWGERGNRRFLIDRFANLEDGDRHIQR